VSDNNSVTSWAQQKTTAWNMKAAPEEIRFLRQQQEKKTGDDGADVTLR